jgi:hypothetical protein
MKSDHFGFTKQPPMNHKPTHTLEQTAALRLQSLSRKNALNQRRYLRGNRNL